MQKAKKFDIEDSNIELLGSQADKDARKKASEGEPAWQEAYPGEGNSMKQPGRAVGMWIWRIEKFKVVSWPRNEYGNFYTGDSYILLNSVQELDENGDPTPKLSHDIHFWIGSDSSQDEYGTAAYKTVELDDYINYHFGSDPVQHREVEGYESSSFLAFFPKGIKFMKGGVDSGFRKVEAKTYKNKLLHVKGKKNAVVREVECEVASMNSGDIFILDAGLSIFQWNGKESGLMEKAKAAEYVQELESERGGKPKTEVYDEGSDEPSKIFWEILGGKAPIKAAIPEPEDMHYDVKMFKVSDATGKLEMTEVKFEKSSLDSNDVFICDFGPEVYVWIGKGASDAERANGLGYATKYLKDHGRPLATPIVNIKEQSKSAAFTKAFADAASNLSFDNWEVFTTDGKAETTGQGLAALKNAFPADESRFCIYHYDKDLIRLHWKGPNMPGMAKIKSNQALESFKSQHAGCKITVEVLGLKNLTRDAIADCLKPGSGLDVIDD